MNTPSLDLQTDVLAPALPVGIRSRRIPDIQGLSMHVLEAGEPLTPTGERRPALLLLHGFPELAYSWRKVMLPLAEAGYYVVAPDQRGYGATTGHASGYDVDLSSFSLLQLVRDQLALLAALGLEQVHAVIGHDFGSPVAGWCALVRPDVFRSVVMMSSPFPGPPAWPLRTESHLQPAPAGLALVQQAVDGLAHLQPPRQHYQWYYSGPEANRDMLEAPQGLHAFLRAYYHVKSADWPDNRPHPLPHLSAESLGALPTYYVMRADQNMAQTVAEHAPTPQQVQACRWLTEDELSVYSHCYGHTGFQGGLNWYRCGTSPQVGQALSLFAGRTLDVPSAFMSGRSDWGTYQFPGVLEKMSTQVCTRFEGIELIDGAGHWVQQEQPQVLTRLLLAFLSRRSH
jgi:pimeloyl-ACP methyl ester carboxylesterase